MGVPITRESVMSVMTSDATTAKVFSFNAATDGIYHISVEGHVFNETDGTGYSQKLYRSFKRVSGTITALASSVNEFAFGDATVSYLISNTGDELYVEITGVASKNIDWNIEILLKYT